jgi:hypothetical protein
MMIPDFSDMTPYKLQNKHQSIWRRNPYDRNIHPQSCENHKRRMNSAVHTRLQAQLESVKQDTLGVGTFRKGRL